MIQFDDNKFRRFELILYYANYFINQLGVKVLLR